MKSRIGVMLQLDLALKLCREWNAFTFKLPLVDTALTFGGLDWKHEKYDNNEYLTVMTPDGEFMQWTYNRNGTLQGKATTMGELRLKALKPIMQRLQQRLDEDQHYQFCDNGHMAPRHSDRREERPDFEDDLPSDPLDDYADEI